MFFGAGCSERSSYPKTSSEEVAFQQKLKCYEISKQNMMSSDRGWNSSYVKNCYSKAFNTCVAVSMWTKRSDTGLGEDPDFVGIDVYDLLSRETLVSTEWIKKEDYQVRLTKELRVLECLE